MQVSTIDFHFTHRGCRMRALDPRFSAVDLMLRSFDRPHPHPLMRLSIVQQVMKIFFLKTLVSLVVHHSGKSTSQLLFWQRVHSARLAIDPDGKFQIWLVALMLVICSLRICCGGYWAHSCVFLIDFQVLGVMTWSCFHILKFKFSNSIRSLGSLSILVSASSARITYLANPIKDFLSLTCD